MAKVKYTESYLKFYEVYPRHEGKSEGQRAWSKLDMLDQQCALQDVEKRNRHGAWSSNKRLVKLPASYLNSRGWEDDWMATLESSRKPEKTHTAPPPVDYKPIDNGPDMPWYEAMINRVARDYILSAGPLETVQPALEVKRELLKRDAPMLLEELEGLSGDEKSRKVNQVATDIIRLFLKRLDNAYGLRMSQRVENNARRRAQMDERRQS